MSGAALLSAAARRWATHRGGHLRGVSTSSMMGSSATTAREDTPFPALAVAAAVAMASGVGVACAAASQCDAAPRADRQEDDVLDDAAKTGNRTWVPLRRDDSSACRCEAAASSPPVYTLQAPPSASRVMTSRRRTAMALGRHATTAYTAPSRYVINDEPLGEGSFGTVHLATDKFTGDKLALKRIGKEHTNDESFRREMDALLRLRENGGHPHICSLRENFDEKGSYVLVLDLIEGGEMFDHLIENGAYSELDASRLLKEVASALAFMHGIGVVHVDLKPENLMMSSKRAGDCVIKVVDFGSAEVDHEQDEKEDTSLFGKVFSSGSKGGGKKNPFLGRTTPAYCPPEVIDVLSKSSTTTRVDPSLDMWSLGIILYIMLVGAHPFDQWNELEDKELEDKIRTMRVPELDPAKDPCLAHLSPAAIDLLTKLLADDPKKRLTAQEMLSHPWVTGKNANRVKMREVNEKLASFKGLQSEIEKTVFERLIGWSGKVERHKDDKKGRSTPLIEQAFKSFDREGKGRITKGDVEGGGGDAGGEDCSLTLSDFSDLVSDSIKDRYFPAGKVIYEEGDKGDHMYFIDSGTVEILTKDGFRTTLAHGSTFGEGAMFHPESKRNATVRCKTPVHAMEVNRDCFMRYLSDQDARSHGLQLEIRERTKERKFERAGAILSNRKDLPTIKLKRGEKVFGGDGKGAEAVFVVDRGIIDILADGGKVAFSADSGDIFGLSCIFADRTFKEEAVCTDPAGCAVRTMAANDFRAVLDAAPKSKEALEELFLRREVSRAIALKINKSLSVDNLKAAFDAIDKDGSGDLDSDEVRELLLLLNKDMSEENIQKAIKSLDLDDSGGSIDFEEFKKIFAKSES